MPNSVSVRLDEQKRLVHLYGPPAVALCAAVLPLGALQPTWALLAALVAALALAFQPHEGRDRVPVLALPFFGLAAWSLLQAVPLPPGLLGVVAPHAADVWAGSRGPLGPSTGWHPISLAPALTVVEGAKWASYGALAWAGETLCRKRSVAPAARIMLGMALLVGALTVAHGALDVKHVYGFYKPKADYPRWHIGPLLNVNHLSGYLSLGVYAGLALALSERKTRHLRTAGFLATAVALVTGVVLLASRGAVAALVVGVVLATAVAFRVGRGRSSGATAWQRLALPAAVLVSGAGLALLGYEGAISKGLGEKNVDKLLVAKDALAMVKDNLWTGVGRGAFGGAYHAYKIRFPDAFWTHPENIAIQWVTEWGLPATIAGTAAVLFALRRTRAGRSVGAAVLAVGLLALLAQNLVDYGLELPGLAAAAAMLAGAVTGERSIEIPRWTRLATAGAIALSCFVGVATRPVGAEDARLEAFRTAQKVDDVAPWLSRFPADPYFPFLAANLAARESPRDPRPALTWANRALLLSPHALEVHSFVADVLHRTGRRSQALLQVREAAVRCPGWEAFVVERAYMWSRTEAELLSTVPEGAPNEGGYLRALAMVVPDGHPGYDAVMARHLERAPCDLQVLSRRATARITRLSTPACEGAARAACANTANEDVVRLVKCPGAERASELIAVELLWSEGKKAESVTRLDKACERGLGSPQLCTDVLAQRAAEARELSVLGRIERQLASLRCTSTDGCLAAWKQIASWHLGAGDPAGAMPPAKKAVELVPGDVEAQLLLGRSAERAGAVPIAVRAYQAVLARNASDPEATAGLARLLPRAVEPGPK